VERIVKELAKIAFSDVRHALDWECERDRAGVNSVRHAQGQLRGRRRQCRGRLRGVADQAGHPLQVDKLQALEKLGKHLGMFKDDAENVSVAMRIVYDAKAFGAVPSGN
jgi:hypothetical protein